MGQGGSIRHPSALVGVSKLPDNSADPPRPYPKKVAPVCNPCANIGWKPGPQVVLGVFQHSLCAQP